MTTTRVETVSSSAGRRPRRPTGTTLATVGLGLAAVGPVLVILGIPAAAPFVAPFILIPAVGAALVWRFGMWSKILAIVLGLLLLAALTDGPPREGLKHPASFFDFVPSVMYLAGATAAKAGAVVAIRSRHGRPSRLDAREGRVALGIVAVVVAIGITSALMSVATNQTVDAVARADAIEIVAEDGDFTPAALPLQAGETRRVVLRNDDPVAHTFSSDVLGIDETLLPGDEVLVELTPPSAGTFQFWCRPHSGVTEDGVREGMVGTLEVR